MEYGLFKYHILYGEHNQLYVQFINNLCMALLFSFILPYIG